MNRFEFGPFELDPAFLTLRLRGQPLALGPRVVATLLVLVERAGEVVTKDELLERVWAEADVEEANVAQNVYVLRKVFRACWSARAITTVPRRGYVFSAPVRVAAEAQRPVVDAPPSRRPPSLRPTIAAALLCIATVMLASSAQDSPRSGPLALGQRGAELYALGHYYWTLRTKDGFAKSVRYFEAVTRTDPHSPLGYAGLAEAYALMPEYDMHVPSAPASSRAWAYARKALALDPRSSEAHAIVGHLQSKHPKRLGAGRDELDRAIALDPRNAPAHLWLGTVLHELGMTSRARGEFETAERLEPASPATESWLASELFLSRDYAAAADRLHRALDLDPERQDALEQLGTVEAQRGKLQPALEALARLSRTCRCDGYPAVLRAYAFARTHRAAQARAAVAAALRAANKEVSVEIAFVYVALGDHDRALAWLRRARTSALLALDPRLDPVRGDPRFRAWTNGASVST